VTVREESIRPDAEPTRDSTTSGKSGRIKLATSLTLASAVRRQRCFRVHDLRHSYAALMVAAGAHPKYLQAQIGHSSIRVTLDLYGHLFPDTNRGVLDSLDAITAPSKPHRANAPKTTSKGKVPVTRDFEDGSDGTRTRDLRRDRPAF